MVKIIREEECGDSPGKLLVRNINLTITKGGMMFAMKHLSDDITVQCFEPAGQKQIQGS